MGLLPEGLSIQYGFHQRCIHPYSDPTRGVPIPTGIQPYAYHSYRYRARVASIPTGGPPEPVSIHLGALTDMHPSLEGSHQGGIHSDWDPTRSASIQIKVLPGGVNPSLVGSYQRCVRRRRRRSRMQVAAAQVTPV